MSDSEIELHPVVSPFREVITYHRKETCNNCGSLNEIQRTDSMDNIIHECDTKCTCCGFRDHWVHGFFESMIDEYDACEKYQENV